MPSSKITVVDAREWVETALRACLRGDFTELDDVVADDFIDGFRPVKAKAKAKATTSKKTSPKKVSVPDAPYDELCCEARATKKDTETGFRLNCQCNNVRPGDSNLCKTHQRTKISKKGMELGLYTAERPLLWADGSNIIWLDSSDEIKGGCGKKKVKRKTTCSTCGIVGHTKTTCPQRESVKAVTPVPPVEDPVDVAWHEQITVEAKVEEKVEAKVEEKVEEKVGEKVEETGYTMKEITGVSPEGEEYVVEIHTPDNTAPVDFEPEPEPEPVASNDSQATEELTPDNTAPVDFEPEPEPEPVADNDSQATEELTFECDSDDDTGDSTPLEFDGVSYELDADGTTVYDDEGERAGDWNGEAIVFKNTSWKKAHEIMKNEANEEIHEPELTSLDWSDLKAKAKELGVDPEKIGEAVELEGKERLDSIISFINEKM